MTSRDMAIVARARDGVSYRVIAAEVGLSVSRVGEIATAAGVRREGRMSATQRREIVRRALSGETYSTIAPDFKCSPGRVCQIALDAGIKRGYEVRPRGEKSRSWKGGRKISTGYVLVQQPGHPRADTHGYVPEHILVAERVLGKPLPAGAVVHHVNRNRSDNRPANLVICESQAFHAHLHQRMRAFEGTGHANWLRCSICKTYDAPARIYCNPGKTKGAYHPECIREYNRRLLNAH